MVTFTSNYPYRFTHLIQSYSRDAFGGIEESFTEGETYWGNLVPTSPREQVIYAQLGQVEEVVIVIRQQPYFSVKDRLQNETTEQVFEILGIDYDRTSEETYIAARRLGELSSV